MTKIKIVLLISVFISSIGYGQDCNCEKNYEWVKKTFEENDAGFQYVIDKKGKEEYNKHNNLYLQKVKTANTNLECTQILHEWLTFFRSGHIAIRQIDKNKSDSAINKEKPKTETENWETLNVDLKKFEKYLVTKKEIDYEGIWEIKPFKIGIKKEANNYIGFIIESGVENWKKGQVIVRIKKDGEKITSTIYSKSKSPQEANLSEINNKYLQIGNTTLKRLSPKLSSDKIDTSFENYFKSTQAAKPFIEELNKNTLVLRIPSFFPSAKKDIDSLILNNRELILQTENLIIDLRNNGGGSDESFKEILPFIYTNPIRSVGVEFYSTKLNNQRMLDFIDKPEYGFDEEGKKWAKEAYGKLEKQLGQFVNLENSTFSTDTMKTIYSNPKNVGIIINRGCGSTTEEFLLAAKQSKKVKLFGVSTFGSLDISNMYFVKSPCNDLELGYCLSKSYRIPDFTIDEKGLQPDYYIDKSIPQFQWVEFVNEVLNAK